MSSDLKKEFCNVIHKLAYSRGQHEVFTDFCEISAITLRQPFEKSPELEKRFYEILKPYSDKAKEDFATLLGIVVQALTENPRDFLGGCYHALELHNQYKGQFFTPFHLSYLMAEIALGGVDEQIKEKGYVSLSEPACGSGGMVVAASEVLKQKKINPVNSMWVVAQDIDYKCCCMSYIQMTLLAIPGAVIWGDTLKVECKEQWLTSGFYLYPWASRFLLEKTFGKEESQRKYKVTESGQMEFEL